MEAFARVKRLEEGRAIVEIDGGEGCGRCNEVGGCRSGTLTQVFRKSCREFAVPNSIGAREGDRIVVRMSGGSVSALALATYLLPLLGLVLGAVLGGLVAGRIAGGQAQLLQVLGGISGLAVGGFIAARTAQRRGRGVVVRLEWPGQT